jgi:hypothetical protein
VPVQTVRMLLRISFIFACCKYIVNAGYFNSMLEHSPCTMEEGLHLKVHFNKNKKQYHTASSTTTLQVESLIKWLQIHVHRILGVSAAYWWNYCTSIYNVSNNIRFRTSKRGLSSRWQRGSEGLLSNIQTAPILLGSSTVCHGSLFTE